MTAAARCKPATRTPGVDIIRKPSAARVRRGQPRIKDSNVMNKQLLVALAIAFVGAASHAQTGTA